MSKSEFAPWASAPPSWISSSGESLGGSVLSSRVRVARNLLGVPFPHHATPAQQKKSLENILEAFKGSSIVGKSVSIRLNHLSAVERMFLMERQLISHEHAEKEGDVGLMVSSGETLSIMINEEDHVRAAGFRSGLALSEAWETITQLDDELGGKLPLSYNSGYGYLTACPTNMGTGLRASCLLHLPALVITGKIRHVIKEIESWGLTARGFYGEGTTALGDLFQVSNVRTLGQTEAQIIKDVEQAVKEICQFEKSEEQNIKETEAKLRISDQIYRSFGTLQWAKTLDLTEAMKHVSLVRLGLRLGVQLPVKMEKITSLFFLSQPAHLLMRSPRSRAQTANDQMRSNFFRSELGNK